MLDEVALTPDIFDDRLYSSQDACDIHLRYVREPLLQEVLVRDMRDGDWSAYIGGVTGRWHPKGRELFRKLATQGRLRSFQPVGPVSPILDDGWCDEAIATSGMEPLAIILSTIEVAKRHAASPVVHSIETVTNSMWWKGRSPSKRIVRNITAFRQALRLVLANSNSLMFIDPHLDPTIGRYANFIQLLLAARRTPATRLEVHRCCYEGSGNNRTLFVGARRPELVKRFQDSWATELRNAGVSVSVFVWPEIHDRFLISNLMGVNVSNGFDESGDANERVMLTRLSRNDSDEVQRQHDLAVRPPHYVFQVT
jgi:hypothetical protein